MMTAKRTLGAATLFAALVAFGCGDPNRFLAPLPTEPLEATLYDLFGVIVERPAAFNLSTGPGPVRSDITSEWDFVFALVPAGSSAACLQGLPVGRAVLVPRGCFEGLEASSGIARSDRAFDELVEASGDAATYATDAAVPADSGVTYTVRSRPDPTLSATCRRYLKMEVLSLNPTSGSVTFRYLWNPNCNLRRLAP